MPCRTRFGWTSTTLSAQSQRYGYAFLVSKLSAYAIDGRHNDLFNTNLSNKIPPEHACATFKLFHSGISEFYTVPQCYPSFVMGVTSLLTLHHRVPLDHHDTWGFG